MSVDQAPAPVVAPSRRRSRVRHVPRVPVAVDVPALEDPYTLDLERQDAGIEAARRAVRLIAEAKRTQDLALFADAIAACVRADELLSDVEA